MKVKLIIISIVLLLAMVFACGCIPVMEKLGLVNPTNEEQLSPEKGGPPDGLVKVLIGFKEKPGAAQQAMVKGLGGKIKYTYNIIPAIAASVPEVAIEALKKNPNVTDVEMDTKVYAFQETTSNWGIEAIGADIAHTNGHNGNGIEVAVIDTGIDYGHEELSSNYAGGYDFVNLDSDPIDDNGHGTHVAGIIAAGNPNISVAPAAELYALKALDSGGVGYVSDIISAIQWASDPNGDGSASDRLDIINMSFGANVSNIFLRWACNLAYRDGLLLVAAAGNEYGGPVGYPAAYNRVIAVSATNSSDELAYFSNTGPEVELAAPGVDIYSTMPTYDVTLNHSPNNCNQDFDELSGTSMACPHVVGAAALVWAANDGWNNDQVRNQLTSTAKDIGLPSNEQGYGLVNCAAALGLDEGEDTTPPAQVTGLTVSTVSWAQLDLAWSANTEIDLDHYNVYRSTTSGGSYSLVASLTTNSYSDVGLTAFTTYYYIVSAVDVSGNEGEASNEASGTTSADDLLGPMTSEVAAEPNPTNGANFVILTANVSDVTTGNSNIAEAEYFVDTVGTDATGTTMSASDGGFDSTIEEVTASIDVSDWAVGEYILYVQGKDAIGNWGASESVMLDVTGVPSKIMYVKSIIFSEKKAGPNKFLYTTIKVVDGDDVALEGVRVEIDLNHTTGSWNFAGDTGTDGKVKFTLKKAPSGEYTATATSLVLTSYEWDKDRGVTLADYSL